MLTETKTVTERQVEVASEWWTNQLRKPSDHDAGDADLNGTLGLIGDVLRTRVLAQVNEEKLALFKAALAESLRGCALDTFGPRISVDYDPDRRLMDAWNAMGVSESPKYVLPVKTTMWLRPDGGVEVKQGYGRPLRRLPL